MATVDCKVCGTETDETLRDHLDRWHMGRVFDLTFDPATQHAEVRPNTAESRSQAAWGMIR